MELIIITYPFYILDIGVGFGYFGFLTSEYLDIWGIREGYYNWISQIDGIEICKEYLTPVHDFIYNDIHIGNAIDILPIITENYDCILLIDIIEHFHYNEGIKLLEECKKHGRNIIISTPMDIDFQEDSFGNPYETHKFHWKKKHFHRFINKFFIHNNHSLICYIGDDATKVERILKHRRKSRIKYRIKKLFHILKINDRDTLFYHQIPQK